MKTTTHQVEYRAISELNELEGNPRTIKKDDFERLKKSLQDNQDYFEARPIILSDRTGKLVIIAGNQRYKAAKAIGLTEVPTVLLSGLTEEREREIVIRDNVENGEWDMDILANEWDVDDLKDWGAEINWEAPAMDVVEDDFTEPDDSDLIVIKPGEIYQCGNHRIMCGDSTCKENVDELTGGVLVDMVFTDPPYNMDYSGKGIVKASRFGNLKDRIKDIIDFNPDSIKYLANMECGQIYIFTSKDLIKQYLDIFKGWGFNLLIWEKTNTPPFTNNNFLTDIEYLLYFHKGKRVWNNGLRPINIYKKFYISSSIEGKKDAGDDLHPTMKPVRFIADKIQISSKEGGGVLDLFGGSGTTMIACEQTGRKCFMMELDPHYVAVIIKRWEDFTGQKAVKIKEAK